MAASSSASTAFSLGHARGHAHGNGHGHGNGHHHSALSGTGAGGGGEDPVQSKADFLSTFTEDPHLLNFARHFCDAGGDGGNESGSGGGSGGGNGEGKRAGAPSSSSGISSGRRLMLGVDALGDASALARYFGGALLECLAGEKAEALGPHLSLCHSAVTARHTADAAAAWDLRLVLDYGRGSALQTALASAAAASAAASAATPASSSSSGTAAADPISVELGGVARGSGGARGVARGETRTTPAVAVAAEVEPPLPFALLHPELLASLEVRLDAFFSSLGFDGGVVKLSRPGAGTSAGTAAAAATSSDTVERGREREQQRQHACRLRRYLRFGGRRDYDDDDDDDASEDGGGTDEEHHRLFGAYLAFFGIPAPAALERALGGRRVPPEGLGLGDAPALLRGMPGLAPSALLKITSPGIGLL